MGLSEGKVVSQLSLVPKVTSLPVTCTDSLVLRALQEAGACSGLTTEVVLVKMVDVVRLWLESPDWCRQAEALEQLRLTM